MLILSMIFVTIREICHRNLPLLLKDKNIFDKLLSLHIESYHFSRIGKLIIKYKRIYQIFEIKTYTVKTNNRIYSDMHKLTKTGLYKSIFDIIDIPKKLIRNRMY